MAKVVESRDKLPHKSIGLCGGQLTEEPYRLLAGGERLLAPVKITQAITQIVEGRCQLRQEGAAVVALKLAVESDRLFAEGERFSPFAFDLEASRQIESVARLEERVVLQPQNVFQNLRTLSTAGWVRTAWR